MEASVAATDGAAAEAGAEQGTQAQESGADLSPILGRFDELSGRFDQLVETFNSQQQGGEEGEGEEGYDFAELFGGEEPPPGIDPQALQELMDARVQQALDARVNPLLQQVEQIQVGLDAEQLTARYPALADPKVSGPVLEKAQALAESVGQPGLINNMQFIESMFKAHMADQYAAGERPVGVEKGFELERASGAGPAAGDEPNIAQRVIASRKAENVWSGWS